MMLTVDLRSSQLTLDNAKASSALYSLNRSLNAKLREKCEIVKLLNVKRKPFGNSANIYSGRDLGKTKCGLNQFISILQLQIGISEHGIRACSMQARRVIVDLHLVEHVDMRLTGQFRRGDIV